jgi:hypothetical protein
MPSSFSCCVGFTERRGSRKRLSSAKTCHMNQPHLNLPKIITVGLNDVNQSRSI